MGERRRTKRSRTSKQSVTAGERSRRACELRLAGASYREIAAQLGTSLGAAHKAVGRAMAESLERRIETADHLRQRESERLDRAQLAIWPALQRGDLGAVEKFVRLSARRAALLGLDLPTKTELTGRDGGPVEMTLADLHKLAVETKP